MLRVLLLSALALTGAARAAQAEDCRQTSFEDSPYTVCAVTLGQDDLRLWMNGPDGKPLSSFDALGTLLQGEGKHLGFAMNAGMFLPDQRPVGLTIIDGQQIAPIVTGPSGGNFGMLPNGVFCIAADGYHVIETRAFAAHPPACRYATQSGPMLVIAGALHPRFLPGSTSLHIRNGVGVSADGRRAAFAISDAPVSFDAFARFFRDALGMPDALYLDGSISSLDAPVLDRNDQTLPFAPALGPMIGTAVDGPAPTQ